MQDKTITILSSRGRGISADLSLMRSNLAAADEEMAFRSFSKNERSANFAWGRAATRLRKAFCEEASHMLCIDGSISGKITHPDGKRLLLAVPYDYQFKNALLAEKKELHISTLKKFTHIIPGSPFTEELLKKAYRLEESEIISDTLLPLAWNVADEECRSAERRRMAYWYPEVEKARVLTILTTGDETKEAAFFDGINVRAWLDGMPENFFVFTNSRPLMEQTKCLSSGCRNRFAYVNRLFQPHEFLYVTDVLLTNNGRLAAALAAAKKTVCCLEIGNTCFERYMHKKFPSLCCTDPYEMTETWEKFASSGEGERFWRHFAYETPLNPYSAAEKVYGLHRP